MCRAAHRSLFATHINMHVTEARATEVMIDVIGPCLLLYYAQHDNLSGLFRTLTTASLRRLFLNKIDHIAPTLHHAPSYHT